MTVLAPLPNHNRITDPLWQRLFHHYRHVITPLRYGGWTTDMETSGGEFQLRADLGDSTELIIASEHSLPADPAEVTGWTVIRRRADDPGCRTVLYDSTPNGPQAHHDTSLVPLFARISRAIGDGKAPRLIVSATHTTPYGANHNSSAGLESACLAVARFAEWSQRLINDEGYGRVWERCESGAYPLALFERAGHITILRVTRSDD